MVSTEVERHRLQAERRRTRKLSAHTSANRTDYAALPVAA